MTKNIIVLKAVMGTPHYLPFKRFTDLPYPKIDMYMLGYFESFETGLDGFELADFLFNRYNVGIPSNYYCAALSTGDILIITEGDKKELFYCDHVGWQKLDYNKVFRFLGGIIMYKVYSAVYDIIYNGDDTMKVNKCDVFVPPAIVKGVRTLIDKANEGKNTDGYIVNIKLFNELDGPLILSVSKELKSVRDNGLHDIEVNTIYTTGDVCHNVADIVGVLDMLKERELMEEFVL